MRVTNEQAMCDKSNFPDKSDLYKYAADILEARELIEKQEEIIKEMRGIISRYVKLDIKCEVQDNLNRNATSILEKTKEYSE